MRTLASVCCLITVWSLVLPAATDDSSETLEDYLCSEPDFVQRWANGDREKFRQLNETLFKCCHHECSYSQIYKIASRNPQRTEWLLHTFFCEYEDDQCMPDAQCNVSWNSDHVWRTCELTAGSGDNLFDRACVSVTRLNELEPTYSMEWYLLGQVVDKCCGGCTYNEVQESLEQYDSEEYTEYFLERVFCEYREHYCQTLECIVPVDDLDKEDEDVYSDCRNPSGTLLTYPYPTWRTTFPTSPSSSTPSLTPTPQSSPSTTRLTAPTTSLSTSSKRTTRQTRRSSLPRSSSTPVVLSSISASLLPLSPPTPTPPPTPQVTPSTPPATPRLTKPPTPTYSPRPHTPFQIPSSPPSPSPTPSPPIQPSPTPSPPIQPSPSPPIQPSPPSTPNFLLPTAPINPSRSPEPSTTTPRTPLTPNDNGQAAEAQGLSSGETAGLAVGLALLVALGIILGVCCYRKRRNSAPRRSKGNRPVQHKYRQKALPTKGSGTSRQALFQATPVSTSRQGQASRPAARQFQPPRTASKQQLDSSAPSVPRMAASARVPPAPIPVGSKLPQRPTAPGAAAGPHPLATKPPGGPGPQKGPQRLPNGSKPLAHHNPTYNEIGNVDTLVPGPQPPVRR